jgi:two-component system chemotaxis response regulator CheY
MDTTILVVDDSKMQLHLTDKILRGLGYVNIELAISGEEAKNSLNSKKIDLVFSDWHMPGVSGLDLLKFVRSTARVAAIPFVIITTEHDKSVIFEAAKAGVTNYVFKPINKDIVKRKLYDLAKLFPSLNPPHESL